MRPYLKNKDKLIEKAKNYLETTIGNITHMFQEIKNSSKNTTTKNEEEIRNEEYDKLKLLLKMS